MSILYIQFPEEFNKKCQQYRQMLLDIVKEKEPPIFGEPIIEKQNKDLPESQEQNSQTIINEKPHTMVKNGVGYFKFHKQGENIKIGGVATRPFNFLQCLCSPNFGIEKTTEAVFDSIKIKKDLTDNLLAGFPSPQKTTKIISIIELSCIKELQKIKELKRIKYNFNNQKTKIWLSLED